MTFSRFVYKNMMRNRRRTLLTVLSIAFSLFLVVVLQTALEQFIHPRESDTSVLRLAVRGRVMTSPLPLGYQPDIEKVPGVKTVIPFQWFGGQYREQKNFFPNFATDPYKVWDVFPEFTISEESKKALCDRKDGAIVGEKLMEKFGWKIGDRVTLKGTIFPVNLDFVIVGTYWQKEFNGLYFRYDYFNEAMGNINSVANFWVMAENEKVMSSIIENIDGHFANTAHETHTETEKAFRLEFLSSLGNIQALVSSLLTVIVFTMILVAGSTMAMTIRERTREIGILKSMGFPSRTVLTLILGEALMICMVAYAVACTASLGLSYVDVQRATMGFVQRLSAGPKIYVFALVIGVSIGILGSVIPAVRASGMTITQALRREE